MQLKELFGEDRAVSPVIGVILMVAITVILAAVIGTFVLGLGDRVSTSTPSASFGFDYSDNTNDTLEISHGGGDTIDAARLSVSINGAGQSTSDKTYNWTDFGSSGDVNAGSTATVDAASVESSSSTNYGASTKLDLSAASADVVWTASSGDSSAVLGSWEGPSA